MMFYGGFSDLILIIKCVMIKGEGGSLGTREDLEGKK